MRNVLLVGNPADRTIVYFLAYCELRGLAPSVVSLYETADTGAWDLAIPDDGASWIRGGRDEPAIDLSAVDAVYFRWTGMADSGDKQVEARRTLLAQNVRLWSETAHADFINRPDSASHNGSKSLHEAFLSSEGFAVPPSITSSDPTELVAFAREHESVVLKTVSGVRAQARFVDEDEFEGYSAERGPVHLQQFVGGSDLRIHVIGDQVVAIRIESRAEAVDYRSSSAKPQFELFDLDAETCRALVSSTARQGLTFAGWDFKATPSGELWCLECNPMPGYSYYDRKVDGAISEVLVDRLWESSREAESTPGDRARTDLAKADDLLTQ
jgi:glutathione synthase/RimK-type ligase-like ATP-grasp enzyme